MSSPKGSAAGARLITIDPSIAASIVYVVAGNSISRGFEKR